MFVTFAQSIVHLGVVPGVLGLLGFALAHERVRRSAAPAVRPTLRAAVPCASVDEPVSLMPASSLLVEVDEDGATVPYASPRARGLAASHTLPRLPAASRIAARG